MALTIVGTVCPRSGELFAEEAAKSITPARKRNILILDNASRHKRESLNWHFFKPLCLTPYVPDFNTVERIWLIIKAEHFTNIHCRDKAAPVEKADFALCDLMDNQRKVASAAGSTRNAVESLGQAIQRFRASLPITRGVHASLLVAPGTPLFVSTSILIRGCLFPTDSVF